MAIMGTAMAPGREKEERSKMTSNTSEEGRAKNRRVELVAQ